MFWYIWPFEKVFFPIPADPETVFPVNNSLPTHFVNKYKDNILNFVLSSLQVKWKILLQEKGQQEQKQPIKPAFAALCYSIEYQGVKN